MTPLTSTRRASTNDLESILDLFVGTIASVNAKDYDAEQLAAWMGGASRKERWLQKIKDQHFLVAEQNNDLVGFGSITTEGYLDFMYVSKDHQGCGVAKQLLTALEEFARSHRLNKITSDVSITAKPFFSKQGFQTVQEQTVHIEGISLTNYKMEKTIRL